MSTARAGMAAASARLEATARRVASYGATPLSEPQPTVLGTASVRIGYLPLPANPSDPVEDITSMMEDAFASKANAAVFRTSTARLDALYRAVD